MPKKSSSIKAPEKAPAKPVVEDEKPSSKRQNLNKGVDKKSSSKPKKWGNEIDEIFAGKKRKKPEAKKSEKLNEDETAEPKLAKGKKDKKNKGAKEGGFMDPTARPQKKTEEGLVIYTEEELGISNPDAGNTPLCPFDCSCCF